MLRIRDNGPGPPADAPVVGLGLLGMRERAAAVGGALTIRSGASGTLVRMTVPVQPVDQGGEPWPSSPSPC